MLGCAHVVEMSQASSGMAFLEPWKPFLCARLGMEQRIYLNRVHVSTVWKNRFEDIHAY